MLVKLDDDLMAKYSEMAGNKQSLPQVLERQLARFSAYPPGTRVVVLSRETLQEVEELLGGGQIQNPQTLLDRIRFTSEVKLGQIDIPLTPSQKEEIIVRAEKQGKTPEAIVQDLVRQVVETLFWDTVPAR